MHQQNPRGRVASVDVRPTVLDLFLGRVEAEACSYDKAILRGLQSKACYQGTVPEAVVAERRRRNKAARASRRINRSK